MNKRTFLLSFTLVVVLLLTAACSSAATSESTITNALAAPPASELTQTGSSDVIAAYQGTLENIYKQVSPSVVNIRVVKQVDTQSSSFSGQDLPFFNLPQDQQPSQQYSSGLGSGFVWDTQGDIVTNNHVVSGADKIEVTFSDGTILNATLVGADPDSDLAVINVDAPSGLLVPMQVTDSTNVQVGQLAIAIGNPFGLEGTMTVGIISALGRSLPVDSNSNGASYTIPDVIQTDAPINPGNSGGVLVDSQGMLVGVTSAIESSSGVNAGIGFAIPSQIVQNVVPALIKDGVYQHPWLGISGTTITPELAQAMNLDNNQRGVLVADVLPNSPADSAGLQGSTKDATIEGQQVRVGGDVITAIDGQAVTGIDELIAYLARSTSVGQKVTLSFIRDGKEQTTSVTLQARPSLEERQTSSTDNSTTTNSGIHLGILGGTMNSDIAAAMNLPSDQQGVLVEQIEQGSLADKAGLQGSFKPLTVQGQEILVGGDIITAVNGQTVNSIEELKTTLGQADPNQELQLTILRDGKELTIKIVPNG
ncbi:MAG: trypsin-like peptidase domain-containing protein [Anaerolineales bacterium]|nr:trypsin-like peptidase domain-containing protein [Anaerolineales bacterium]